jgi:hypothetical protein
MPSSGSFAGDGNLICLSGNTCYRQVRLQDGDRAVELGHRLFPVLVEQAA